MHHGNRQWAEKTLTEMRETIRLESWARNFNILIQDFSDLSPCEQVKLIAQSKVLIAHHGAVLQGNGLWASDGSVIVEIVSQFDLSKEFFRLVALFGGSNINDFATHTGISAISAEVAYSDSGKIDYYHDSSTKVLINSTRWAKVLEKVGAVLTNTLD